MSDDKKFFNDFSKITNGAFETFGAMRQEAENFFRPYIDEALKKCNLVTREEYNIQQKMIESLVKKQKTLEEELSKLLKPKKSAVSTKKSTK